MLNIVNYAEHEQLFQKDLVLGIRGDGIGLGEEVIKLEMKCSLDHLRVSETPGIRLYQTLYSRQTI